MRVKDQERLYREANCFDVDPAMFFPEHNSGTTDVERAAIARVCGACRVRDLCRQAGDEQTGPGRQGRWGGEVKPLKPTTNNRRG